VLLRYRLYEVDVAIERTLVYASLTLLLAAATRSPRWCWARRWERLNVGDGRIDARGRGRVSPIAPVASRISSIADSAARVTRRSAGSRAFLRSCAPAARSPRQSAAAPRVCSVIRVWSCNSSWPRARPYVTAAGAPAVDLPTDTRVRTPVQRAGVPVAVVLHRATGPQASRSPGDAGRGRRPGDRDRAAAGAAAPPTRAEVEASRVADRRRRLRRAAADRARSA